MIPSIISGKTELSGDDDILKWGHTNAALAVLLVGTALALPRASSAQDLLDDLGNEEDVALPGTAEASSETGPDAEAAGGSAKGNAAPGQRPSGDSGDSKEKKKKSATPGDRVFTVGDRVKSVQRKLILKKGRFEIAPALLLSVNDAFFQKLGGGVAAAYWPSDSLGVFVDAYYLGTIETPNVRLAKQATRSTLLDSRLSFLAAAGFQWSPIYGKVAFLGSQIIHFDLFFSAGFGVVRTSTAVLDGTPPMQILTTFGVGQRYLVNRFLAIFFKLEDRIYPEVYDLKSGRVSGIANVLTLSLGASFFFPMDFKYGS